MNPTREEQLFQQALAQSVADRESFLERESNGDAGLRRRLEALLAAHAETNGVLATAPDRSRPLAFLDPAELPDNAEGRTIGHYKLLEKLGEGGCGVVYVAEQTEPVRRRVALKLIKPGMDSRSVIARFEAERQALALMDHPNIAKILDAGVVGPSSEASVTQLSALNSQLPSGRPYFVMELVRGIRITDYCDQNQLSVGARIDLFIKVCQATQHAHQKGIIHRDLKPSNILVTLHDGTPVPKVIDFGIAKATEGRLTDATVYTQLHQFLGTPAYMSPEQAEMSGLDIDTRSDIYSLGVLLYELLTGVTPFDSQELLASGIDGMRKTIREKEPVRPSTRLTQQSTAGRKLVPRPSSLASDLDWIVMKCLEKDRARRYETANGLAADLKRHLNNEPVTACPPSQWYRLQKAFRRNKLAFAAGMAVSLALLVGTAISLWQAFEAIRARNLAETARTAEAQQRNEAQEAQRQADFERKRAEQRERSEQALRYVANMNLAQQAWALHKPGRIRELLEESTGSPELGFEWHFWQRQIRQDIRTFRGHFSPLWSAAFSPDGRRIVTGGGLVGGSSSVADIPDRTVRIWDTTSGQVLVECRGHAGEVLSVAFSPDGRQVLSASTDHTVRLWDASNGQELFSLRGHEAGVIVGGFSRDGQRILTGGFDSTARIWNATDGTEQLIFTNHTGAILTGEFSPDGKRVITAGFDEVARIWEVRTGRETLTLPHTNGVWTACFSPDGRRVMTGGNSQVAVVWDADTGKPLLTLGIPLGQLRINKDGAMFSPDGRGIVTSCDDTVVIWDAETGAERHVFTGHLGPVVSTRYSPDGQRILTASEDGTAKLWDADPDTNHPQSSRSRGPLSNAALSQDGRRWVASTAATTAVILDVDTGRELLELVGHDGAVKAVAFSPDGTQVATASADQTARLWDTSTGRERLRLRGHQGWVKAVAYSPDGQKLATGGVDRTARLWDVATGQEIRRLDGHKGPVQSVVFSPNGKYLATASGDHTARVWDTRTGQEYAKLEGHLAPVQALAFSPDSQHLATSGADLSIRVWDLKSSTERSRMLGHVGVVATLHFSPDGRRLVTADNRGSVRVWIPEMGKEVLLLVEKGPAILHAAFSPDGQRIRAMSRDQSMMAWDAASPEQLARWIGVERDDVQKIAAQKQAAREEIEKGKGRLREDPGAIRQWLILAPIPLGASTPTKVETLALDTAQIPREAYLRPQAGEAVHLSSGNLFWTAVSFDDHSIDFNDLLGETTENALLYAVAYLHSDISHTNLTLWVGSDDSAKVFLNGKEVHRMPIGGFFAPDAHRVDGLHFNAGLNTVVFKVVNTIIDWRGAVRFSDSEGQPIPGIHVTLNPHDEDPAP